MRRLVFLSALVVPAGFAQGSIPVNGETQDYISPITTAVNSLVLNNGGAFLAMGLQLLTTIGVIMLVIKGVQWGAASASRHHGEFDFPALIQFFGLFLVAEALLRYYNTPLPWTNVSLHQLFPETGRQLAAAIDLSTLNGLLAAVKSLLVGEEHPSIVNPMMIVIYYGILVDMILIEGILFALNILAFVMVGIGSILGPLFIPWLMVPRLNWLFWNWLQFMLQYSFFQIVASALTNVWATVLLNFFTNSVHGDYSLAHFAILLVPLGLLNIGFAACIFKAGSITSDLFTGTAAAGGNLAGSVSGVLRGAFA